MLRSYGTEIVQQQTVPRISTIFKNKEKIIREYIIQPPGNAILILTMKTMYDAVFCARLYGIYIRFNWDCTYAGDWESSYHKSQ